MPRLIWAVTCARIITDNQTNSVSYVDAVEQLRSGAFPAPFPPIYLGTLWRRSTIGEELRIRVRVTDPSGKDLISFQPKQTIEMVQPRHRLNVNLGGPKIAKPGEYTVIVEQPSGSAWKVVAELPIEIERAETAKPVKEPRPRRTATGRSK